jgi:threonyl-tRNA synthetase
MVKDSLGREWQCATEQLDFVQPQRFGLTYVDSDGSEKTPVMIHKALLGSIERFMSVYIEHTAGNFPLWLSYTHAVILPISTEKHLEYAEALQTEYRANNIRVEIDSAAETLGNRIRKAQAMKVPYMIIVGDKEMGNGIISLRTRDGQTINDMPINDFTSKVKERIDQKTLDL